MHSSTMSDVIAFPPNRSGGLDPLMGEARERQQRRRQRMAGAVVIAVVVAGILILTRSACSESNKGASNGSQHAVTTAVNAAPPLALSETRAVITDWYVDGVFNSPHRCAAVRAAINLIPNSRVYSRILRDTRLLERRTCG
jgi:hypothetical protein